MNTAFIPPIVILVRPQMGENIGAVARAMSNFGLEELRLVAPRDGWPNPRARKTASGAEGLVKAAKLYPDFASATADIQLAYATTARPRDMEKRVLTPWEAAREMAQTGCGNGEIGGCGEKDSAPRPQIALVFGPERAGLENEEITWCDTLVTIPTARNASLNLAQSAVILGYEWLRAASRQMPDAGGQMSKDVAPPAPMEEWQGLFGQLEGYLDAADYFRVPHKKPIMWENLRTMLLRGRLSSQEVRTLRGMLRSLWERRIG